MRIDLSVIITFSFNLQRKMSGLLKDTRAIKWEWSAALFLYLRFFVLQINMVDNSSRKTAVEKG